MTRRLGRAALRAIVRGLLLCLAAFGLAHVPMSEPARERLLELTLAPALVFGLCITALVDWLGPQGFPERASVYASLWTVRAMMLLTVSLAFLALVGLALLSDKVGWQIPVGIAFGVAGVASATESFSEPIYPRSGASPETWLASTVAICGMYLIVGGIARNLPGTRALRLASQVALACTVAAASWLAFLVAR